MPKRLREIIDVLASGSMPIRRRIREGRLLIYQPGGPRTKILVPRDVLYRNIAAFIFPELGALVGEHALHQRASLGVVLWPLHTEVFERYLSRRYRGRGDWL